MPVRVRFTGPCAGRSAGDVEDVVDESLAAAWVAHGAAEIIKPGAPEREPEPNDDRALATPPKHAAIRRRA